MTFLKRVKDLPFRQQVALWIILRMNRKDFFSSDVANSELFTDEGRKAVGGILSALYRNGFIEKIQGGRNKKWIVTNELNTSKDEYLREIFKVKTYWSNVR